MISNETSKRNVSLDCLTNENKGGSDDIIIDHSTHTPRDVSNDKNDIKCEVKGEPRISLSRHDEENDNQSVKYEDEKINIEKEWDYC